MADQAGQADIRSLDIDKLAKGFADEATVFKKFINNTPTVAREIRWYQKTSGFITGVTTTGITGSPIANVAEKALPSVAEQSWTRTTSYVRKYMVDSPWLSAEDIKDNDVDILATNLRDLVRAIEYQIDARIWAVISEGQSAVNINSVTTNAAWNAASYTGVNIVEDIMEAKQKIRTAGYNPEGGVLFLNSLNHKSLITWLIDGKGSSIPSFSSQRIQDGVVMEILGLRVVISENVTADYALVMATEAAPGNPSINAPATWKEFMPITAVTIEEKGIGTKIRVWAEGECILHDPKMVTLISNTDS